MLPSRIIRTVGLVTVLATVFVHCSEIHELMTDDEINMVFRTTRENIPKYEVVTLTHNIRHTRGAGRRLRLQFTAFGEKIDAYLNPEESILAGRNTPVWLASANPDGTIEYKKMRDNIMGIVVGMFASHTSTDLVLAWQKAGKPVAFEGFINELLIRSLPNRLLTPSRGRRELISPEMNGTLSTTYHHVIIKASSLLHDNDLLKPLQAQIASRTQSANETHHSQSKRSTKNIIYPSILIQTDYRTSKTAENDLEFYDELIYQLAFWNAVDLRFRSVKDPKIRLRIAGIIIGLDREVIPFLDKYRQLNRWVFLPKDLPEMNEYWSEMSRRLQLPREAYDIGITLTDNEINFKYNDTRIYRVPGFATTGTLCRPPNKAFDALAVVSDRGGFHGVTSAVHDLGHILGLTHDENTDDDCDASLKFIMSPLGRGPNNLRWSRCSLRKLSELLRAGRIDCVDEPAEFHKPGTAVKVILPGLIENADQQCRGFRYSVACEVGKDICRNMKCAFDSEDKDNLAVCDDVGPAAEGTACAEGHVCLDGSCQCLTMDCMYESED